MKSDSWKKVSSYEKEGIKGVSYRSQETKINKDFSVGIFFGTYESRGLVSSQLLKYKSCEKSIIVFFKELKSHPLRIKYDKALIEQVKMCTQTEPVVIKDLSVSDVEGNIKIILGKISLNEINKEKKWFIDIVGSPKPYFLGILGFLRQVPTSPKLIIFNPTGYYEKKRKPRSAFSFTSGFDRYLWIPWHWGRPNPSLHWTFIFLLGFEGIRSYDIYDRFEPKYVEALIGRPGYMPNYDKITKLNNLKFLEEVKPKINYANAADAITTWQKVRTIVEKMKEISNICIVPLGTKSHALGGSLAALSNGIASLLYLMPKSFVVRDIPRGKFCWLYEIYL